MTTLDENTYETLRLEDNDRASHIYQQAATDSGTEKSSTRTICLVLGLLGIFLFCMVISAITGVVVYKMVDAKWTALTETNGAWSEWSSWSMCTASCDVGQQSRNRTCNEPAPFQLGRHCGGNDVDVQLCNSHRCPVPDTPKSAFSVWYPKDIPSSGKLAFTNILYNFRKDYNKRTGTFRCSKPGVYFFSVSLTKRRNYSNSGYIMDQAKCQLYVNRHPVLTIRVDGAEELDKWIASTSNSALQHLDKGDTVSIRGCNNDPGLAMEHYSSFMGFLIYPDL